MKNKRSTKTILVIEDDKNVSQTLTATLKTAGYEAEVTADAEEGFRMACGGEYSLLLVDAALPKCEGYALLTQLRRKLPVPIIIIGSRCDECEELRAFELGADDYIAKPFSQKVLAARVNARINRASAIAEQEKPECTEGSIITIRELRIDTANYKVTKKNKEIELSKKEYEVLLHLALHVGRLMSREDLLTKVWGYDGFLGDVRTVDVTMSRLRSKIEDNPGEPEYIFTKRSKGYYIPV